MLQELHDISLEEGMAVFDEGNRNFQPFVTRTRSGISPRIMIALLLQSISSCYN